MDAPRIPPLGYIEECRLIEKAQAGDIAARNRVWENYLRLVLSVVNRVWFPDHLLADAIQEGSFGLLNAIEKFDVTRFHTFSLYAWRCILGRIVEFHDQQAAFVVIPSHLRRKFYAAVNRGDSASDFSPGHPFRSLISVYRPESLHLVTSSELPGTKEETPSSDRLEVLDLARRILSPHEWNVLKFRYGLWDEAQLPVELIGKQMLMSPAAVRQTEFRALKRLRARLRISSSTRVPSIETVPVVRKPPARPNAKTTQPKPIPEPPALAAEIEVDLLKLLSDFPFRQANAVIHYYGLFKHSPLPIRDVAKLLDISQKEALSSAQRGSRKLLRRLYQETRPEFCELRAFLRRNPPIRPTSR